MSLAKKILLFALITISFSSCYVSYGWGWPWGPRYYGPHRYWHHHYWHHYRSRR